MSLSHESLIIFFSFPRDNLGFAPENRINFSINSNHRSHFQPVGKSHKEGECGGRNCTSNEPSIPPPPPPILNPFQRESVKFFKEAK